MHDGRHKESYREDKKDVLVLATKINGQDVLVRRKEVKDYCSNPEFLYLLSVYNNTKLWGLPNGQGWANEPCEILDGITAIEIEAKAIEKEELDKSKPKNNGDPGIKKRGLP